MFYAGFWIGPLVVRQFIVDSPFLVVHLLPGSYKLKLKKKNPQNHPFIPLHYLNPNPNKRSNTLTIVISRLWQKWVDDGESLMFDFFCWSFVLFLHWVADFFCWKLHCSCDFLWRVRQQITLCNNFLCNDLHIVCNDFLCQKRPVRLFQTLFCMILFLCVTICI